MSAGNNIGDCHTALQTAQRDFSAADGAYSSASAKRTDALNALNKAQKEFDAAVTSVRAQSAAASDWGAQRLRMER